MVETSSQSHLSPRFRTENVLSTHSLPISTSSLLLAWPQIQVCEFLYLSLGRGACYFTYTKFCQVWLIFHLSFQIWKITDLFLYSKDRNPSHLAALMFHTQNWNATWACVRIYFCRPWICSVHSSWLLQWMKQITILISHLANSISVTLQPISQPNAFCSTIVYLSLEAKLYDELWLAMPLYLFIWYHLELYSGAIHL